MHCEIHPEDEAVGTCGSCGRGACVACKVIFAGVLHCKRCVESDRLAPTARAAVGATSRAHPAAAPPVGAPLLLAPPLIAVPQPIGKPGRSWYQAGAAGYVAAGIASIAAGVTLFFFFLIGYSFGPASPWLAAFVITTVALAALNTAAAAGLYGLYRNCGARFSRVGAFGLVGGSIGYAVLALSAIRRIDSYYDPYYAPYPYITLDFFFMWLAAIALATGLILEGIALIGARRFFAVRAWPAAVGIVLIVAGGLFAGVVGLFLAGYVLVGIARLVGAALFLRAPVPVPVPGTLPASPLPASSRGPGG